jgi:hypothetical protein
VWEIDLVVGRGLVQFETEQETMSEFVEGENNIANDVSTIMKGDEVRMEFGDNPDISFSRQIKLLILPITFVLMDFFIIKNKWYFVLTLSFLTSC